MWTLRTQWGTQVQWVLFDDVCFCGWLPKCLLSWGVAYSPASASPGLPSLFWGVACSQASTSLGLPSSSILQIHLSKVQYQLDCSELFAWCTVAFKIKYKLISLLFDILPSLLSISKCVWVSVSASGEKKLHLEVSAPAQEFHPCPAFNYLCKLSPYRSQLQIFLGLQWDCTLETHYKWKISQVKNAFNTASPPNIIT